MQFRMKADIVFEANDVEDACRKLAAHFLNVSGDNRLLQMHGVIDLDKCDEWMGNQLA